MKCVQAKRLFGSYWDDEASQAEREWLESHLGSCAACRTEYELFTRALEMTASLPRVEPAPDLLERVMARARRSAPAQDRLPSVRVNWVPVTAAVALLLTVSMLASPWVGFGPGVRVAEVPTVIEAQRTEGPSTTPVETGTEMRAQVPVSSETAAGELFAGAIPDSLFDHSEDVEFVLDPVTVRRGRATLTRFPSGVQGEHAVITF